ncbi:hypothetical protein EX30DRAFT_392307 [Ascodesmis nigricans]|uniref:PHD-type domain-containing protein n=1 Tax=Ascodesmis nigricans TaxID=341454 RepID=A0A4S2N6F3_9PEZI|nr:hypothetical protein EX30DRAFT_392307 [Ascodesmis nigricans]
MSNGPPPPQMTMDENLLRQQLHTQPGAFTNTQSWATPPLQSPAMAPPATIGSGIPPPISTTPSHAQSPSSEVATPRSATRNRRVTRGGISSARTSRRRKMSVSAKEEDSDGSMSEEFTMEGTKTKSGRRVHRPTQFNPAAKTPSRRRGPYRRNYDARTCKVCQRGHSPQSNMIVFCDGCNTPYHQLCHNPIIDDDVVANESSEWFCALCAKTQNRPLTMGTTGAGFTEEEKHAYLSSLPVASLIEIIFAAEKAHPDLRIYDPDTRDIVTALRHQSTVSKDRDSSSADLVVADDTPNWEDMICRAIKAINPVMGVQPKFIFEWIGANYPALEGRDVRAEAQSSLQNALRKERLLRDGHAYRVNPEWRTDKIEIDSKVESATPGILAPGKGVRLPSEVDSEGMALLVDEDKLGFSHKFREVVDVIASGTEGVNGSVVGGLGLDAAGTAVLAQ